MSKRTKKILASLLAVILLLSAAGCGRNGGGAVAVTAAAAENQELETTLELSGVLVPVHSVDIASKISGKVVSLGFSVGSAVKAGDILMQLDTDTLSAQLAQAEAGLQSAGAAAEAAVNQASLAGINLDAAQKLYDRTKVLYESGAVSQSQMDDITDKLNIARNQYENASGPAQAQAQAAISTARANIRNIQVQIDNAAVRSPLDGIVTVQNVNAGQVVTPNVAVISIVDTSTLKLKSTVSQDLLPLLSVGREMDVTIDSYPDSRLKGTISGIGPIAVSTGEVFPLEIAVNNSGGLTAGLSARAATSIKVKGIVVPASAVVQGGGESCVFVINSDTAVKRVVKVGLKNDQNAQILNGLSAGEKVAVTNVGALSDNKPVVIN
ncbi:efflux RND transporter periplasmic adaptor subunit [Pelotomaculum propionicicum]|uniref:efflux RND transporter periplasmic adaptor subunit n=1 Tax=Pelotomaculum propionicicum TaxID=258475 RepID=UPI003B7AE648